MIRRTLFVGRWNVSFLFADHNYDKDEILSELYDLGATDYVLGRVEDIVEKDSLNTGFTYTNPDIMRALIVIGPTSSGSEFIDTLVHEVHHIAVAVAYNLGIDLNSETPAYLAGDTARELANTICEFGCRHCRRM